jgi:pimeloyl-ACP methyl ester carboxylesterase
MTGMGVRMLIFEGDVRPDLIALSGSGLANIRYRPPDYLQKEELKKFVAIHPKQVEQTHCAEVPLAFSYEDQKGEEQTVELPVRVFRPPVVFVHGFTGGAETWEKLDWELVGQFWDTLRERYYFADYSIAAHADKLRGDIMGLKLAYGKKNVKAQKVDLVAHSMGGLISRYYISLSGRYENDVRKLIMVATPNQGCSSFYPNDGVVAVDSAVLNGVASWRYDGIVHSGLITPVPYKNDFNICEYPPAFDRIKELLLQDVPRAELANSDAVFKRVAGEVDVFAPDWRTAQVGASARRKWIRTGTNGTARIDFTQNGKPFAWLAVQPGTRLRIAAASLRFVRIELAQGGARFKSVDDGDVQAVIEVGQGGQGTTFTPSARVLHLETDFDAWAKDDGSVEVYSREGALAVEYWDKDGKTQGEGLLLVASRRQGPDGGMGWAAVHGDGSGRRHERFCGDRGREERRRGWVAVSAGRRRSVFSGHRPNEALYRSGPHGPGHSGRIARGRRSADVFVWNGRPAVAGQT